MDAAHTAQRRGTFFESGGWPLQGVMAETGEAKCALRAELVALRRALAPDDVAARGARAQTRLLALPAFARARTVALYAPLGGEVPTDAVLRAALAAGKTVCFPVVPEQGRILAFRAVRSLDELAPAGRLAIREPAERSPAVPLEAIDLFVVPALGYTRQGHRLGRGGGYYDATLRAASPSSQRVGLALREQVLDALPVGPGDVPVDQVVTEEATFTRTPTEGGVIGASPPRAMTSFLRRATPDEQFAEVTRGSVDLHVADELKAKLRRSYEKEEPLVVKAGFDSTAPDLHLGHTLLLTRMRRFQDFGHRVVFLIGDFTALIGDPSGKNATRPALSRDDVLANAETYKTQVFRVLLADRTEVRFNSEWLDALGTEGLVRLAARWTLARMLEREDFKTRFREGRSIALHELLYPLLQGYDSVALQADVELGSSDQLFNLLVGRTLMRELGMEPQVILTGPILEGLDGREKMSKSLDNFVGIAEPPEQMFGKLMSISDDLLWRYLELLSARPLDEVKALRTRAASGSLNPKEAKAGFAEEMVARFHGAEAGRRAGEDFERRFARKQLDPESLPEHEVRLAGAPSIPLVRALADTGLVSSTSEGRRLIGQGAVRLDGSRISDLRLELGPGTHLVQVGKLRAARLRIG